MLFRSLYGQQAVMVKRLVVPVRRALLDRLAVLPAPEIKVSARITEAARGFAACICGVRNAFVPAGGACARAGYAAGLGTIELSRR